MMTTRLRVRDALLDVVPVVLDLSVQEHDLCLSCPTLHGENRIKIKFFQQTGRVFICFRCNYFCSQFIKE